MERLSTQIRKERTEIFSRQIRQERMKLANTATKKEGRPQQTDPHRKDKDISRQTRKD